MSITVGDVVLGVVGSCARRGVALVGSSVNIAARLLKQAPPGGIIASGEIVAALRDVPRLADEFQPLDASFVVPGADGLTVATYVVPPALAVSARASASSCSSAS